MPRSDRRRRAETAPSLRRPGYQRAARPCAGHAGSSRRTPHPAASPRSTARVRARQRGSSSDDLPIEERREIDRMTLQLLEKDEEAMVAHALRIEDAVEVVAFVLDDPGMKPRRLALD